MTAGQVRLVQEEWSGIDESAREGLGAAVREMLALDVEELDAALVLDGQSGVVCTKEALLEGTMALLALTRATSSGAVARSGRMQRPAVDGPIEQAAVGSSKEGLGIGDNGRSFEECCFCSCLLFARPGADFLVAKKVRWLEVCGCLV